MINPTETDERKYLQEVKKKLQKSLDDIHEKVRHYAKEIREQKEYLWENKTGMDHVEKISVRQSVDQSVSTADMVKDKSRRIGKLLLSPYFGRFDFIEEDVSQKLPIYVGIHAFFDEDTNNSIIYDWRAPISTMFYDYETGEAQFVSPGGEVKGEITLKRQYRIRQGEMEFMIESDLNIHDDILQKELSLSSDDKMKNIVATIQRDQNAIIRNENSEVLIIQGVAGSGKTSIALHRIAFLLYRFKETTRSKDVLIISPNKVFADYIANVLPELGEEKIPEIGIEELAKDLLNRDCKFQTFFEQVSFLLEKTDKAFEKRIQKKASLEFLHKLKEYIRHIQENCFVAEDLSINGRLVPAWLIQEKFAAFPKMPIVDRLSKLPRDIEGKVGTFYNYSITKEERRKLKEDIKKMYKFKNLRALYKNFYVWLGDSKLFKMINKSDYEYCDVFPLIYLKMHWEGLKPYEDVKHLLVDEMQDYTPVQYEVLSQLFKCKKTILGDANQSVNPFSSSSADEIKKVLQKADTVKLNKSYRSTFEITKFAQNISPNKELEAVERHGEKPLIISVESEDEEIVRINHFIEDFQKNEHHSMGIICRTQSLAEELYAKISNGANKVYLFSSKSDVFRQGVVVCTSHMAKGLEFDHVLVPQATKSNYKTLTDRGMLYVACTRAMHRLTLTHVGEVTSFL